MAFQKETRSVEDMRTALIRLSSTNGVFPNVFYDTSWAEFRGKPEGQKLEVRATEVAELTVQEHGSAYQDYQSISKAPLRKIVLYVGGINTNKDILVVGADITQEGNIGQPARLSLQDLVGYRTIEQISEKR